MYDQRAPQRQSSRRGRAAICDLLGLREFYEQNPNFIFPAFRQKQVLEFLKDPLNDLCISRPKERLEWGIPLPFDEGYVT